MLNVQQIEQFSLNNTTMQKYNLDTIKPVKNISNIQHKYVDWFKDNKICDHIKTTKKNNKISCDLCNTVLWCYHDTIKGFDQLKKISYDKSVRFNVEYYCKYCHMKLLEIQGLVVNEQSFFDTINLPFNQLVD